MTSPLRTLIFSISFPIRFLSNSNSIFKSNIVDPHLLQLIKNFNKKKVPVMPLKANVLMEKYNIPEGKVLGGKLKLIEEVWCNNNFQILGRGLKCWGKV